jgi:hypothetical protein
LTHFLKYIVELYAFTFFRHAMRMFTVHKLFSNEKYLSNDQMGEVSDSLIEEYRAAIDQLEDLASFYRITISSRNDFVLGIFMGLISSILIVYVMDLERMMNPSGVLTIVDLTLRIGVLIVSLAVVLYTYWIKTARFKEASKNVNKKISVLRTKVKDLEERNNVEPTKEDAPI